jgi:chemotaxis family two-component system response regulator Rcp1
MTEPFEILLIDDNAGDARLIQEGLRDARTPNRLSVVEDGMQALAFLRRQGLYAGAPRPGLILLDLNLPKKNGREVLAEIKQDSHLRRIPVVVLSSSQDEHDIAYCYDLHANCYIVKPVDVNPFFQVIRSLAEFWFKTVSLPPVG